MKYQVHQMAGMKLPMPTMSISVDFFVLSFCFVELTIGNPRPKDKLPPKFPHIIGWTANNASKHHFKILLPLVLRSIKSLSMILMHHIRCTNLSQLSSLGARTLNFRNAMGVQVSGLALLVEYKVFATRLWKSTPFLWSSLLQYSFTAKKWLRVVLDYVPLPFGSALWKVVKVSSM